jgi:Fe-S-cluster containining protein
MFHKGHRRFPPVPANAGEATFMDFTEFFEKYEKLVESADKIFEQMKEKYPDCVKCKVECSDCCHALFDVSFVEALSINKKFREKFQGSELEKLLEKANKADRQIFKLKRDAYREFKDGRKEDEILEKIAKKRVRCPMLNDSNMCDIYEFRPITCRIYGIPTAIGGRSHSCGLSGFKERENYPTVNMDILHEKLYDISEELVRSLKTQYPRLSELMVPLSMALLTDYDDEYLGISSAGKNEEEIAAKGEENDESEK